MTESIHRSVHSRERIARGVAAAPLMLCCQQGLRPPSEEGCVLRPAGFRPISPR